MWTSPRSRTRTLVRALTNAWKVLHVVGVSLAEAGRYWMVEGEGVGRDAVEQVLALPTLQSMYAAEEEIRTALTMLDPGMHDRLEEISEELTYWEGPDSPNVPPELDLVTPPLEDDDPDYEHPAD